ncbi:patatin-like protein [Altererythrobacter aquiaggeris]|uniref:patatin-like protein n=1 Tax=Aestuarierythrobacter aquiaggeris TaxID=1898396 RepID=UPI00301AA54A
MRQKELRIALVCYGGVSLAVYMHGVTKELWKLARASRAFHSEDHLPVGAEGIYNELLCHIEAERDLKLRVLPDILTGASAGGINAVFLAQAIHSGQSLEPLTDLWLEYADVEALTDPDAVPWSRVAKLWAMPLVGWLLRRPGNMVSDSVASETREEVRGKISRLVRGRWFEPPFSGLGFSKLLCNALDSMARENADAPLLPPNHPIDLFVTATDFRGYLELLRLNSPPVAEESEHRLPVSFRGRVPREGGVNLADPLELTLAARSTASFPGAFPPLQLSEIDRLAAATGRQWTGRADFLERIMPVHVKHGNVDNVSLIDGSVLINAPFGGAISALKGRPAQREVDRRFVYIDPRPDRFGTQHKEKRGAKVGFFSAILGSLSTLPREQPIRDNLEEIEAQSLEAERMRRIVNALRPEVESAVERLFGRTLFLDKPTPKRLKSWRNKAQQAAAEQAGYPFHAYAQTKFDGIVQRLARVTMQAAPHLMMTDPMLIEQRLRSELAARGLDNLGAPAGGASPEAIVFFREHDIGFRIRRLRLIARRLSREWETDPMLSDGDGDTAREAIFAILSLYFEREGAAYMSESFGEIANNVLTNPGAVLDAFSGQRELVEIDDQAEQMLAVALAGMSRELRRRVLLAYLGFPFYDVATLPLLRNEGLTEFDPIKVDRISPDDAISIRAGGTLATLRGTEFYNFGAFFSRAYRENDYLWGRLHGAERMVDLVCSTVDEPLDAEMVANFKKRIFLAILTEEEGRLTADSNLVPTVRGEVEEQLG